MGCVRLATKRGGRETQGGKWEAGRHTLRGGREEGGSMSPVVSYIAWGSVLISRLLHKLTLTQEKMTNSHEMGSLEWTM